ncbi:MAG: hypothetical protein EOO89_10405 [Pedobacter sp.]|nr:MAG: hypothetical protein EOO89_10405 [Pedobacter sp.]
MKLRLTLLFLLFCTKLSATVFLVTNNADSGTGTLREALVLASANGSSSKDYIHFNLIGNNPLDRTITIYSELPLLSSNLVIDASTQPGPNLGISSTKIILRVRRNGYFASQYNMGGFNLLNLNDVEIYSFCFVEFMDFKVAINPNGQTTTGSAINIASSNNIQIGTPTKGNIFIQNGSGINAHSDYGSPPNRNVKIQANWFGLNIEGIAQGSLSNNHLSVNLTDSEFGGPDLSHGNILGGYSAYGLDFRGENSVVRFNRFGYNGDGTVQNDIVRISLFGNNNIMSDNIASRFNMEVRAKKLKIVRNIETSSYFESMPRTWQITESEDVEIGNNDIDDANTFLKAGTPLFNSGSVKVSILKNIINCTPRAYQANVNLATFIQVLVNNDTEFSGKATPNADVYIYNDYTDCSSCSPLQFFTEVKADPDGNWKINGDFSTKKLIANSTYSNASSDFTQPLIIGGTNTMWNDTTQPSCGQANGSIRLNGIYHVLKIEWYNVAGKKIGEGAKIENLPAGGYYAKGFNGKCYTQTDVVHLLNRQPNIIATNLTVQNSSCGQNNGFIKGLYYSATGQTSFKWVDGNNRIINTGNVELNNLGPGDYTLMVTGENNCTVAYGPISITNTNGPNINQLSKTITKADCNTNNGAVSGISTSGNGTLQYIWTNAKAEVVGNEEQLTNVPAGTYQLTVTDESSCSPVSETFTITDKNDIIVDISSIYTEKPTCNGNNGKIGGITVVSATFYEWFNDRDQSVSRQLELSGVGPGKYYLVASNYMCKVETSPILLEAQTNQINIGGLTKIITNASCGLNNGGIQVTLQSSITPPQAYRWTDKDNNTLTERSLSLTGMPAGIYHLYGSDAYNCELFLATYEIGMIPMLKMDYSKLIVTSDKCSQKIGSVKGLVVSGGVASNQYLRNKYVHSTLFNGCSSSDSPR